LLDCVEYSARVNEFMLQSNTLTCPELHWLGAKTPRRANRGVDAKELAKSGLHSLWRFAGCL
ncbi:MAG: hypothetical protein AAFQ85_12030, partial [Pseudomonadota bacterium]